MGLFDGYDNMAGSSAELAGLLHLPVILVVNARSTAYTVAAILYGFKHFRPDIQIAGAVFNFVGSESHYTYLQQACRDAGVEALGYLPKCKGIEIPSRHLGLNIDSEFCFDEFADRIACQFGKGNPAGVWASETANNASLGGALIPMMALGIPGDGITAMLIAGLTIHGLQAGPLFMTEQPDLAMLIFACVMVSAIVTYLIQIITKRWFPYILKIPYHYLYTVILLISFIAGYGISNTMFNIYVMLALCLLALFMSVAGLPTSPLVLAFILSSKLERYFRQGISYAHGSYAPFFTRPVSFILLIIAVLCVVWPYVSDHLKAKKSAKAPAAAQNIGEDINDD